MSEYAPFGQMEGQPLRVHDEHGMFLSHFSLSLQRSWETIKEGKDLNTDRLHSAHAMTPYERFHSRSLYLPELAVSLRPESGMAKRFEPPELVDGIKTIYGLYQLELDIPTAPVTPISRRKTQITHCALNLFKPASRPLFSLFF